MKRDKWSYGVKRDEIIAGVEAKLAHHKSRLEWWRAEEEKARADIP
jgi:hypothetical protein